MKEDKEVERPPTSIDGQQDTGHRSSPQSDPTNTHRQESAGDWVAAEHGSEAREGESGMTDEDRQNREMK